MKCQFEKFRNMYTYMSTSHETFRGAKNTWHDTSDKKIWTSYEILLVECRMYTLHRYISFMCTKTLEQGHDDLRNCLTRFSIFLPFLFTKWWVVYLGLPKSDLLLESIWTLVHSSKKPSLNQFISYNECEALPSTKAVEWCNSINTIS